MDRTIIPSAAATRLPRSVPILVRTNIGTNICFTVSEEDTVQDLQRRIVMEHANIHPNVGVIKILHLKVKWGKSLFSLSDSMLVRDAFYWIKDAWVLYVDASSAAAARDVVATSAGNQIGANGGECARSFKVACKELNDEALGISIGRSKSPDQKHHQQDPSVSMDKIIEASNDILIAEERVHASRSMYGLEMTTASVAMERGGDKSNIHSISVSATELADPFSEPQQNPIQTEGKMKKSRKSSEQCAASEKDNKPDELINSSIAGITDFNILEKPNSRTAPHSPDSGNALTIDRESPAYVSKVKLPDISNATRFDKVAEIPIIPEGSNLEIPHKRKKKTSRSQKNLSVQHVMIDISSAAHENVSDIKKPVEKSPPISEPMDKMQFLSPHIVSMGKATEKSKDVLHFAEAVDCVSGNLLDDMDMMNESVATKKGGNRSDTHLKSFETVELAYQSVKPQKNDIRTKKKEKRRKCSEQSAASEGTNQNRLSNLVMTVAIDSHTDEMPRFAGAPDSLLYETTLSRGRKSPAENLKVELPSGKRTDTSYVEFADMSRNPKEAHLEVPLKCRRTSSSHQKKISSHGKSDTASAAPENVNHAKMTAGESAAPSDLADKEQQQNEQNNEILEATDVSPFELEKESPLGKEKTPVGAESSFILLALPVSMEKSRRGKRKKSGNAEEAAVNSLELEKGSFPGIKGTGKDLEVNNLNNGLDVNKIYANIEFPEGVNGSHDKQSNGLLSERAPDDLPVDEQNCSSVLLDKSAASSVAMTKKLKRNKRKNEKFKVEIVKSSGLCLKNQGTEETLETNCMNKGLDGNANTDLPGEINGSHDEKYVALPLTDKTPNRDPAEVKTDDCSELPRASIEKSVFMEIFSPQELETSLNVEENPSAFKSGSKKPPKASRTSSRKFNAQKEDDSADTLVNHSRAKHKKKSRHDKLSDHKENSDGPTRQKNLQEEDTEKRPGMDAGIFTANGKLDTKPTPPNNGRRQVKSLLSKVDTLLDKDSPIASGENTGSKSKRHCSMNRGNDSKFGATAYPGQTHVGVTTSLKIAAPSLSSASTEDKSPTSTSHFRVAVRQNCHDTSWTSSRAAGQGGVFSARAAFCDDFNNETSDEHDAVNRAANLGSDLNHESQQETQFPNAQVIDYRDSSSVKNVDTKNRSGKNSLGPRASNGARHFSLTSQDEKKFYH